jgi:hypothetical protein
VSHLGHHYRLNGHCPLCDEYLHTSRPVMNSPAQAEARDRVHAAPGQADSPAVRRVMAGPLSESEARPVMPTARFSDTSKAEDA